VEETKWVKSDEALVPLSLDLRKDKGECHSSMTNRYLGFSRVLSSFPSLASDEVRS
jgi:hypothetical protein